ncbi:hypothetical protein VTO42DRAFT_3528 [Malbranchea cinnamomea]
MESALGTRSIRRTQFATGCNSDFMHGRYLEGSTPKTVMQQIPLTPTSHPPQNVTRLSNANHGRSVSLTLDTQPGSLSAVPSNSGGNDAEQGEASGKVQLDRHRSVRSEICVSPSWSRSEERRKRKKELKRLAKEQKDLKKKLKREAKGKPREPRRLTKAGPSSRASSAYSSFPPFSAASSIRSFWSNRTSRASSVHDPEECKRPRRNSTSSHPNNTEKKKKFLGVLPRRSNAVKSNQEMPKSDRPVPMLHTSRKVHDLRASAQAFEEINSTTQPSRMKGDSANNSGSNSNSRDTVVRTGRRKKHHVVSPETPTHDDLAVINSFSAAKETQKKLDSLPSGQVDNAGPSRQFDALATLKPLNTAPLGPTERPPSRKANPEKNKPGDFRKSSFSRRSPLDDLAANAAFMMAEGRKSQENTVPLSKEPSISQLEPAMDQFLTDAVIADVISSDELSNIVASGSGENSSQKQIAAYPGNVNPIAVHSPPEPDSGVDGAVPEESSPITMLDPEPAPSAPAEPSPVPKPAPEPSVPGPARLPSSHVNGKIAETWRKPTAVYSSSQPNFQSSPLAGPPLVPPDAEDTVEHPTTVAQEESKESKEHVAPRRPAKLQRRSAGSPREDITASQATTSLGTYFPRIWRPGKKEKRAGKSGEESQDCDDNSRSAIRQGKRPVRVVNNREENASSQPNAGLSNRPNGSNAAASLPFRRSASDTVQQVRSPTQNGDVHRRPFSIAVDVTARGSLGSAYAKNGTGTPSLRDLINNETLGTAKGSYYSGIRHTGFSGVLATGVPGQHSQKTAFHPGQPIAKMFVICCQCKYWHDMPSDAYANLVFPQANSASQEVSNGAAHQRQEVNGDAPNKGKAVEPSFSMATNSNRTGLNSTRDERKNASRPSSSRSGLVISTSVYCCWCNHKMAKTCCAGWTALVKLHERHH